MRRKTTVINPVYKKESDWLYELVAAREILMKYIELTKGMDVRKDLNRWLGVVRRLIIKAKA